MAIIKIPPLSLAAVLLVVSTGSSNAQENDATVQEILTEFYITCNGAFWNQNDDWYASSSSSSSNICSWHGITCDDEENVVQLELRNNNVACTLPENIFYLPSLQALDVSGNPNVSVDFSNLDPDSVSEDLVGLFLSDTLIESLDGVEVFSMLERLIADSTSLAGTFPSNLAMLPALTDLDLSDNLLTGTLPHEIYQLLDLQYLFVSNNMLTGTLAPSIGALTGLSQLFMEFNDLTGTLPTELTQLNHLTYLFLNDQTLEEGNGFTGPMLEFAGAPNLMSVDVSNNALTGAVPINLLGSVDPHFSNLIYVDMSGNQFTGVIPAELSRFQAIRLYLSGNSIQGIDSNLCSQNDWFFGDVGEFGCDGILCPPGSFNTFGRQISAGFPCEACVESNFFGATRCVKGSRFANNPDGLNAYETVGDGGDSSLGRHDTLEQHSTMEPKAVAIGDLPPQLNFDFLSAFGPEESDNELLSHTDASVGSDMQPRIQSTMFASDATTFLFNRAAFLFCAVVGMVY
jgi:Leucine-rich repeat (LRR) protein